MKSIFGAVAEGWREEVVPSFKSLELALLLAWNDTQTRYRRSFLGPFWLVLGTAIGVGGLGYVWTRIFDIDPAVFIPSLSIGLVLWYYFTASIIEGSSHFSVKRDILLNMKYPTMLLAIQLVMKQIVTFGHNFLFVIVVLIIYRYSFGLNLLVALVGFVLVSINLLALVQLIGYLGARFRDLEPLVNAIMQPLFFLTPVIFRPEQLGVNSAILLFNPLAHWIAIVRDPIMGEAAPTISWYASIGTAIFGWLACLYITGAKRHRLIFWVN
ncbi:MAG: ABC transporter permease [Pseudomonadota bacterium]